MALSAAVIIPARNPGPRFQEVIQAVLEQSLDPAIISSLEVLVIDSGSTDGTLEYLRALSDERVRVHQIAPAEFGHGKTRNAGAEMTQGEVLVFLTHDALPANQQWLNALIKPLVQNPKVAGVFGRHIAYPEADEPTREGLERHFEGFKAQPEVYLENPALYAAEEGYRKFLHFFSNNNSAMRRSVWAQHPFADVDFAEDQVWAREIIEAGYVKAYAHEAVVYHSHQFSAFERFQRSFDEASAFRRYFDYRLCRGPRMFIKRVYQETAADRRTFKMNIANVMGHWLGTYSQRLPTRMAQWCSWDKRLQRGLRSAHGIENSRQ